MFLMVTSLIWGLRLFAISWKGCHQLFFAALIICCFKQSVTTFGWPECGRFLVEPVCWYCLQMFAAVDFLKSVIQAASHSPFLARRAPISLFFFGESCWMQEVLCVVIEVLKWGYYVGWSWFKIYADKIRWCTWSCVGLLILATSMGDWSEIYTSTHDEVMPWLLDVLSIFLYKTVNSRSQGPWHCIGSSIPVFV